jgi:hypothetical protein
MITKAAAKREIEQTLAQYKPWDVVPAEVQDRIHELTQVAYPNGIALPRI